MFCLRSWLPLLFIPTNASPIFILIFFACTYFLNRPCVYCSFLLIILFASSCQWSDHCFFDFSANWFEARPSSPASAPTPSTIDATGNAANASIESVVMWAGAVNQTASTLGGVAFQELKRRMGQNRPEWTGIGVGWLRSLLGKREWRVPCVDVNIRL